MCMFPKKRTVLHRERLRLFIREFGAFSSRMRLMSRKCMKFKRNALSVPLIIAMVSCCVLLACTPPPVEMECPEPVWKSYSHLKPHEVAQEKARLERMLDSVEADGMPKDKTEDSTAAEKLSSLELYQRLFELSIHHANPDYDIKKMYEYVTHLYQYGGKDSLRYLNWGRVVRDQEKLFKERDSLLSVVNDVSDDGEKQSGLIDKLNRERKNCLKQLDSLNSVITAQRETIQKLQKLDVLMEQRRNNIH